MHSAATHACSTVASHDERAPAAARPLLATLRRPCWHARGRCWTIDTRAHARAAGQRSSVVCVQGALLTQDLADAFASSSGYLNRASRELVKNVQAGQTYPGAAPADDQAHSLVKVPIIVARYAGTGAPPP